jgi:predicted phage-related endonuclease
MMLSEHDRQKWLQARRKGMTGTDIAALLGINPWRTALDVYLEKIGAADPKKQTQAMWWGNYLETGMARLYCEIEGLQAKALLRGVEIARAFPKNRVQIFGTGSDAQVIVRHKQHSFLLATMDGLLPGLEKGLELKTSGIWGADEWGEQGTDQVPLHYLTQCAHYMAVSDYGSWDLAAIIGAGPKISGNLALYRIARNKSLESEIINVATRFWNNHILKKVPPEIDASAGWQPYLAKKYANGTGRVLQATKAINAIALEYRQAQLARQRAEEAEMLVRNRLAAILQSADKAQGIFGTLAWVRPGVRQVTNWQALAQALKPTPAQLKKFTIEQPGGQPYVRPFWKREWIKEGE